MELGSSDIYQRGLAGGLLAAYMNMMFHDPTIAQRDQYSLCYYVHFFEPEAMVMPGEPKPIGENGMISNSSSSSKV